MASKRIEKGMTEFEMYREFWMICQKHYIPEPDNDEYHEEVLRDVKSFTDKYNTPWGRALGSAVIRAVQDYEMGVRSQQTV